MSDEQDRKADRRGRRSGTITAASGSSVRGKYTFVTSCRFDEQAHARERERRGEVLHREHAGDDEARIRRCPRTGKFANFPKMTT